MKNMLEKVLQENKNIRWADGKTIGDFINVCNS